MKIVKKNNFKFYYRANTADDLQLNYNQNMFFIPEYNIEPNDIVIDIGSHIGTFAVPMAHRIPEGKIYAIEARKETFDILRKNIVLNDLHNVSVHNIALTNFKGSTKLYYAPYNQNWGDSITNISKESEIVKTNTLGKFMQENEIDHCNFMKINCEGAEFEIILSSSKKTLKKIKLLLILYHSDFNKNHSEKKLIDYLRECDFEVSVRNKSEKRGWIIAKNIK